jgi:hypothetical protein
MTAVVGPVIGKARALVDYTPSPYDKDALRFKVRMDCGITVGTEEQQQWKLYCAFGKSLCTYKRCSSNDRTIVSKN